MILDANDWLISASAIEHVAEQRSIQRRRVDWDRCDFRKECGVWTCDSALFMTVAVVDADRELARPGQFQFDDSWVAQRDGFGVAFQHADVIHDIREQDVF